MFNWLVIAKHTHGLKIIESIMLGKALNNIAKLTLSGFSNRCGE
jgi:hypothetical protein